VKLEERSALDWRFTDRNPHDNRADRAAAGVVSPHGMQGSRPGSALPCPAGRSVPGRGGPERRRRPRPDGTGRAAASPPGLLPTRRWSPRTGLTLRSRRSQRRHGVRGLSSLAVPQACHSQRSLPVHSGQPRKTTKQPRPAPFPAIAGDSSGRTGFGSRWSVSVHSCSVRRSAMKSSATFVP
jgi:hypothetical protein